MGATNPGELIKSRVLKVRSLSRTNLSIRTCLYAITLIASLLNVMQIMRMPSSTVLTPYTVAISVLVFRLRSSDTGKVANQIKSDQLAQRWAYSEDPQIVENLVSATELMTCDPIQRSQRPQKYSSTNK